MKKLIIAVVLFTVILSLINRNSQIIKRFYMEAFNKTGKIYHRNSRGQIDGRVYVYSNGNLILETTYKAGFPIGWVTKSYDNGQLENKVFYKDGKKEGVEYGYYKNGKLNYTGNWRNNKSYGSQIHYLENGRLHIYDAFDVEDSFYYSEYSPSAKNPKIIGTVFSEKIYSVKHGQDSSIVLNNNRHISNVKDLYITVATPPYLVPAISVMINNKTWNYSNVKSNTLKINNAFPSTGKYRIKIYGTLTDASKSIVKADSLKTQIIIE